MPRAPHPADPSSLPWHDSAELPALVPGGCVGRALLLGFGAAMREAGHPVQLQRMRYDRLYALDCLSTAHCLGGGALRSLTMQLLDRYQPWPAR